MDKPKDETKSICWGCKWALIFGKQLICEQGMCPSDKKCRCTLFSKRLNDASK
jgi:hypothetical protein